MEVIQEIKNTCCELLQDDLHSVYIRGSIQEGLELKELQI